MPTAPTPARDQSNWLDLFNIRACMIVSCLVNAGSNNRRRRPKHTVGAVAVVLLSESLAQQPP